MNGCADGRAKVRCFDRMVRGHDESLTYLRESHATIDTTALSSSIVVIGKKNLNPGRSMTISPGKRNRGSVLTHVHPRPSRMRMAPRPTSKRFITGVYARA